MSFDYSTLVDEVRRLTSDLPQNYIDYKEQTVNDSYYVVLTQDGYATIRPSGIIVNGVPVDDSAYTVDINLLHFTELIPAQSEFLAHYSSVRRNDELLVEYIGDTVHNLVEPIFNMDFLFGTDTASETITNETVDNDLRALFVHGAVLQLMGVQISEASGDAIYIKDGDTIIDTAASSREAMRGYQPLIDRWNALLKIVRINRFSGVVMY